MGHISMKREPTINTLNLVLSYLLWCNTDVTSLLSGTAIKMVVAYVTDYVMKSPLKTYNVFETICEMFDRNAIMLGGDSTHYEKTRALLAKVVNGLTTNMQVGSPMAASYLLGLLDHYTSHEFKTCYWRPYVKEVLMTFQLQLRYWVIPTILKRSCCEGCKESMLPSMQYRITHIGQ